MHGIRAEVNAAGPFHAAEVGIDGSRIEGRHVMEDAAIEGYRAGRLSQRQVGAMLGLDYWQTEAFLKERGVPLNYSAADSEADNVTMDKILTHS